MSSRIFFGSSTFLVGKADKIGFSGGMIPEKMFQQILALGEAWQVNRMDYVEKESKVLIRVEETPVLWTQESCPHCGHSVRQVSCGQPTLPLQAG